MGLTLVASTFVFHVAFASSGSAKLIPKVSDYTAVAKRGIVFRMKLQICCVGMELRCWIDSSVAERGGKWLVVKGEMEWSSDVFISMQNLEQVLEMNTFIGC